MSMPFSRPGSLGQSEGLSGASAAEQGDFVGQMRLIKKKLCSMEESLRVREKKETDSADQWEVEKGLKPLVSRCLTETG